MIKEIFYTKNTLYIFLENNISKKTTIILKNRLYSILSEYSIKNIIIDIERVNKLDDNFYDLLSDYNIQFKGKIKVDTV